MNTTRRTAQRMAITATRGWLMTLAGNEERIQQVRQHVGRTLRERRVALNVSLRRVAHLARCDASLYSRLERGKAWAMPMVVRADRILARMEAGAQR